jgi:hypothetical protein
MDLLIQTVALRPYVFAFVVIYLVLALRDLGPGRTLLFSVWTFLVAWIAELASTRVDISFGLYHYTGDTRSRERYLSNLLAGRRETGSPAAGATLYSLVLGFNPIISWWIRETSLFLLGALLHVSLFVLCSCYALGGGQAGRVVLSSSSRTAFDSDQAGMGVTVPHRPCLFEGRLRRRNPVPGEVIAGGRRGPLRVTA